MRSTSLTWAPVTGFSLIEKQSRRNCRLRTHIQMALIRKELPTSTMKTENTVHLGTENSPSLFSTWTERTNDDDYDWNFQNPVLTKTILLTFYPHHQYLHGNQAPTQYWQLIPLIKEKYGIVPTRTYPRPGCQRLFMRSFRFWSSRHSRPSFGRRCGGCNQPRSFSSRSPQAWRDKKKSFILIPSPGLFL